ncbi:UMP kinase [Candidatus Woesearchaeota archaeon]|nr:UMP kinase [Candidatus Woesearchaeota archaeon]
MKTVVISLGGSIIAPDNIDINFLKKFRQIILDFISHGNRAIIVTGGGNVNRLYNQAALEITSIKDVDLDWIGIAATKLNAALVRAIFSDYALHTIINDPREKIETDKKIIIGSGFQPGCSSDKDAVELAVTYDADTIINLSNIDYVYSDDPRKNPDAKPLSQVKWEQLMKIVGSEWTPKYDGPFGPIASRLAMEHNLRVIVANGNNTDNLKNILAEKPFDGTVIKD